jgi:hypothetical protein
MPWRINIDFEMPPSIQEKNALIHRIRNFGEALYETLRKSGKAEIDLGNIDRATNHLHVGEIKTRQVRTVSSLIIEVLEQHHLSSIARLSKDKAR